MQVLARAAQSLPISLLELTTSAHVVFMFAVYTLWWQKPFEVQEPVIIPAGPSDVVCRELLAYMTMYNQEDERHSAEGLDLRLNERFDGPAEDLSRTTVDALDVHEDDKGLCPVNPPYVPLQSDSSQVSERFVDVHHAYIMI